MPGPSAKTGNRLLYCLVGFYLGSILIFFPVWLERLSGGSGVALLGTYSNLHSNLVFVGAILGLYQLRGHENSKEWPERLPLKLFCYGMIIWWLGSRVWFAYNLIGVSIPYPSAADFGYITGILFWTASIIILLHRLEVKSYSLLRLAAPLLLLLVGIIAAVLLWVRGGRIDHPDDPLKFILDVLYPLLDVINILLFLPLLLRYRHKLHLKLIFVGLVANFINDTLINISTSLPDNHPLLYFNGYPTDFFLHTEFLIMSIGIIQATILHYSRNHDMTSKYRTVNNLTRAANSEKQRENMERQFTFANIQKSIDLANSRLDEYTRKTYPELRYEAIERMYPNQWVALMQTKIEPGRPIAAARVFLHTPHREIFDHELSKLHKKYPSVRLTEDFMGIVEEPSDDVIIT